MGQSGMCQTLYHKQFETLGQFYLLCKVSFIQRFLEWPERVNWSVTSTIAAESVVWSRFWGTVSWRAHVSWKRTKIQIFSRWIIFFTTSICSLLTDDLIESWKLWFMFLNFILSLSSLIAFVELVIRRDSACHYGNITVDSEVFCPFRLQWQYQVSRFLFLSCLMSIFEAVLHKAELPSFELVIDICKIEEPFERKVVDSNSMFRGFQVRMSEKRCSNIAEAVSMSVIQFLFTVI